MRVFIFRREAGGSKGEMPEQETQGQTTQEFSFDSWLSEQPEHVRKGYEANTAGLKSALDSERAGRKDIAKQLRDLEKAAEEGSAAKKALGEMSTKAEQAEQRAAFYEEAGKPEIGCTNPKAAFLVATAEGLFKRSGEPDWAAIKQAAPELFGTRKVAPGNAGTGTQTAPEQAQSMNAFIRRAAGR